jgi:hypothetical protein
MIVSDMAVVVHPTASNFLIIQDSFIITKPNIPMNCINFSFANAFMKISEMFSAVDIYFISKQEDPFRGLL